jgi:hypothetical protein
MLTGSKSIAAVVAVMVSLCGRTFAQYDAIESESGQSSEGSTANSASSEPPVPDMTPEDQYAQPPDTDPMGFIGLGLKIGYLHFGNATYPSVDMTVTSQLGETQVVENRGVPSRGGFLLSIPVNIGGSGFGWIFDPYIGFGKIGSYGLFTGPAISIQLSNKLYLGLGFGIRVGIITAKYIDDIKTKKGIDLYGRIPIDVIFYPTQDLGLFLEFGLGYGATGFQPEYSQKTVTQGVSAPKLDLRFGDTYQIDFAIGVRVP